MPSPWARRLLENNDHVATAVADSTLGDRVPQDALIEITGLDTAWGQTLDEDWDGCFDTRGPLAPHRHYAIEPLA